MADMKRPKDPPPRDRRISDGELEKLLIVLNYRQDCSLSEPRQRVAIALLFAIETAMRAGEICAIQAEKYTWRGRLFAGNKERYGSKCPLISQGAKDY